MAKVKAPAPPFIKARWFGGRQTPRTIVIHGTVSPCNVGVARATALFFSRRPASSKTSAHYVVDPTFEVQCVGDHSVAFHCGHNQDSIGIELTDPQVGPDSRWSDKNHELMLARAAKLTAQLALAYGIPIRRISVADLKAGKHGICGHVDMSLAFRQSTHVDPGTGFPWDHFMALVRQAAKDLTAPPAPKPKPQSVPVPVLPAGFAILKADTVKNPPSDHDIVWADLRVKGVDFRAATSNVRATPPMRWANVHKCVNKALSVGASVVAFQEFQGRHLADILPEGWAAVQGPIGNKARAPLAYRTDVWELVRSETPRLSEANTAVKGFGKVFVPSGNRDATLAVLRHIESGIEVAFNSFHSIAHMEVGGHFGWTGKGPKVLLKLRSKMANPAIKVYKQSQFNLAHLIRRVAPTVDGLVDLGDRNFSGLGDLKAIKAGKGEPYGPHLTYARCGVVTIYSAGKLTHGTAGGRGIDYIGLAAGRP